MAIVDIEAESAVIAQLLPGFEPLQRLWHGATPLFPSENAARWFLRRKRELLIEAEALALHRGFICIHREKLLETLRRESVNAYRDRFGEAAR